MSDKSLILGSITFGDKKFELRVDEAASYGREVKYSPEIIEMAARIVTHFEKVPAGASFEISFHEVQDICRICRLIR